MWRIRQKADEYRCHTNPLTRVHKLRQATDVITFLKPITAQSLFNVMQLDKLSFIMFNALQVSKEHTVC